MVRRIYTPEKITSKLREAEILLKVRRPTVGEANRGIEAGQLLFTKLFLLFWR